MDQKFSLSKSNRIYFAVVAVLTVASFFLVSDKNAYEVGAVFGRIFAFLLFPLLFAWIVWRLSGRSDTAGSIVFNVFLTLLLLGQIAEYGQQLNQYREFADFQENKEEFQKQISNIEDPEEFEASYNEFVDSLESTFDDLSQSSQGSEQKFYEIMSQYTAETQVAAQTWLQSFIAVQSPRILDFSLLSAEGEFEYQKSVLENYVEQVGIYEEFYGSMVDELSGRLSVLGEGNLLAKGAIAGATEKYLSQKPVFEPLMKTHAEYGTNMISILEVLHNNRDDWSYQEGELLIYSDDLLSEFDDLIEAIQNNETSINLLANQILEAS